jgi:two-component system response regulator NreC
VSISVVVIDGKTEIREILADWISCASDFHFVGAYADAKRAWVALHAAKPSVVLVDVNLSGVSGTEFVRNLKPLVSATQFMMLTVYEDVDELFESLVAGATGFLSLQAPRPTLLGKIREVYEGSFTVNSWIARKVLRFFDASDSDHTVATLTVDERELLALLQRGYLMNEISGHFGISSDNGSALIRSIYGKMHQCSGVLAPWIRDGLIRSVPE